MPASSDREPSILGPCCVRGKGCQGASASANTDHPTWKWRKTAFAGSLKVGDPKYDSTATEWAASQYVCGPCKGLACPPPVHRKRGLEAVAIPCADPHGESSVGDMDLLRSAQMQQSDRLRREAAAQLQDERRERHRAALAAHETEHKALACKARERLLSDLHPPQIHPLTVGFASHFTRDPDRYLYSEDGFVVEGVEPFEADTAGAVAAAAGVVKSVLIRWRPQPINGDRTRTIDVCVYAELMLESKVLLDAAEGDLARRQQQQVRGLGPNEAEAIHQQRLRDAAARRAAPAPIVDPPPVPVQPRSTNASICPHLRHGLLEDLHVAARFGGSLSSALIPEYVPLAAAEDYVVDRVEPHLVEHHFTLIRRAHAHSTRDAATQTTGSE